MVQPVAHSPAPAEDHSTAHPTELVYIKVAVILTAITLVEVAIWYIQWFHDKGLLTPCLIVLSSIKFVTVVGFYMHLKFDDVRFRYIFAGGLIIALSIVLALYALFHTHRIDVATRLFSD
jgi:cytochrome c oxidase subunit 4